ncbi:MAG: SatD family protein [Bacteroidota bacterium]|nr:SatD family protein [Bacteroidota bacterium]
MSSKQYAVITADIVNSSQLKNEPRAKLLSVLREIFKKIEQMLPESVRTPFEIYRGDSFQGVLIDPAKALLACIIIKVYLRKSFETTLKKAWDARIALGIGTIEFTSESTAEADGQAFRMSGPVLDVMRGENRIIITTPWEDLNHEFEVSCAFFDIVFSRWSASQAEVVLEQLDGLTQQQIADKLNISQVSVHQRLKTSGFYAVQKFLNRYESIVQKMLDK